MVKKIVLIGPESTGKSTLSELLAKHYNTDWVPEYAREFLSKHGTDYSFDNLLTIAKGQIELEDHFAKELTEEDKGISPKPLFIDTDMYVMKVWCEFVFDKCHPFVLNEIVNRQYDLYLLCNVDLPWVKDELREYPDLETREKLYRIYKDIMINQSTPWIDVHGGYEQRLQIAIDALDKILINQ
ncbi:MAG: AAA family ATPase [Sphingobacteriales bacterium]|nr:AAA family ATPase [Sphingobacteriales bacterium]